MLVCRMLFVIVQVLDNQLWSTLITFSFVVFRSRGLGLDENCINVVFCQALSLWSIDTHTKTKEKNIDIIGFLNYVFN